MVWHYLRIRRRGIRLLCIRNRPAQSSAANLAGRTDRNEAPEVADINGNYFQSNLPSGIFAMQSLEHLDISMIEYLNISLPTHLELPNLKHFVAFNSQLYGYLPVSWNTPNLESLILNDNQFTGQLPYNDIGKMLSLKQLMLQNNKLYGNFPLNFGDLHQLTDLSLIQGESSRLCPFFPSTWDTMFSLVNVSLCAYDKKYTIGNGSI